MLTTYGITKAGFFIIITIMSINGEEVTHQDEIQVPIGEQCWHLKCTKNS